MLLSTTHGLQRACGTNPWSRLRRDCLFKTRPRGFRWLAMEHTRAGIAAMSATPPAPQKSEVAADDLSLPGRAQQQVVVLQQRIDTLQESNQMLQVGLASSAVWLAILGATT